MNAPYSIAIRTLGTSGDKFVRLLDSIVTQTIKPEKVIIYIAEGYKKPTYSIGIEEYVEVKKGMVAQRALNYDEINNDYILMLDDDVELAPNSVELLLNAIIQNQADCVAADTFKNHKMSLVKKLYNAFTNLTFPHYSKNWAFKIITNGSSSYNNNPQNCFYLSQSAAGPASLWKKSTFIQMAMKDELWLDNLGFAYGEDAVMFNKLYKNGKKLGILYNANISHLDGKSNSANYHKDITKFYIRSKASFILWYRICYNLKSSNYFRKTYSFISFFIKLIWLIPIHLIASIKLRSIKVFYNYTKGIYDGIKYVNSEEYRKIPNYILSK